jgi:hypothetical protein
MTSKEPKDLKFIFLEEIIISPGYISDLEITKPVDRTFLHPFLYNKKVNSLFLRLYPQWGNEKFYAIFLQVIYNPLAMKSLYSPPYLANILLYFFQKNNL